MTSRLVVIPQAMRVIIPPLASHYLNLTKNSSLAVAIGYPDLVATGGTVLNQTGQAIEIVLHLDGRLSEPQPAHVRLHELVQLAHETGGALSMSHGSEASAYVRTEDAPLLPAPCNGRAFAAGSSRICFSSSVNGVAHHSCRGVPAVVHLGHGGLGLFSAVWTGDNREACTGEGAGACWPFVYCTSSRSGSTASIRSTSAGGSTSVFLIGAAALIPMLIPSCRTRCGMRCFS